MAEYPDPPPDWLPDWRTPDEYPDPETTSPLQWAWEFLRRNPQYQRDTQWLHVLGGRAHRLPVMEGDVFHDPREADPPAEPGETESQWRERTGGGHTIVPSALVMAEYGLRQIPPHPELESSEQTGSLLFERVPNVKILGSENAPTEPQELPASILKSTEAAMVFDLSHPIDEQIEHARDWLKGEQEYNRDNGLEVASPRNQSQNFPQYLRVLDARTMGASQREIGQHLFPKAQPSNQKDRVRKNEKRALNFRDHDYWKLALKEDSPGFYAGDNS